MSADHGFETTPPNPEANLPPASPPQTAEARDLVDRLNQMFAEMTKSHKADIAASGASITDKLDPRIQAIETSYENAAKVIAELDAKYQQLVARYAGVDAAPDAAEAAADAQWTGAFEGWVRSLGSSYQMSAEQKQFLNYSNSVAHKQLSRKAYEDEVEFDFENAVSSGGLSSDFGPGAGVWARPTFETQITKKLVGYTPLRRFARVVPISGAHYEGVLRNTNRDTIEQIQEGATPTQQTQKDRYEKRVIMPYEYFARPGLTQVSIEDSTIPLESELRGDIALDFAVDEAGKLINGTGANEPHGYAVDSGVTGVNSRTASAMDHYDLTNLAMNLRPFYRQSGMAAYSLSTDALTTAMLEEDGFGRRLWQPSNQQGVPSLLNGWQYFEATEQASIATAAKPVFFAAWDLFYRVIDRRGFRIIRDELTSPGLVILNISRRYGGRPWLVEAGRALTIS